MITITVKDSGVDRLLDQLSGRIANATPAMTEASQIMYGSVIQNFDVGGRPAWQPSKRVLAKGGVTLTNTGRLKNSLTTASNPDSARVGTNALYAAIHHFGGKTGRGHSVVMPARPFMVIADAEINAITSALLSHLMGI